MGGASGGQEKRRKEKRGKGMRHWREGDKKYKNLKCSQGSRQEHPMTTGPLSPSVQSP